MNGADLLLHPSLDESFGVVIAEAMALGLPVVAGAASGAVPWVAGAAQWLVDVRSPRAIAAALEQALTDPARYAAASRAARERSASRFAPGPVAEAYLALYRQVLEELRCAA
jgi:glycosyltransferase involved in cell wall biosynthesis